jgi:hypothetical protein
MPTPWRAKKNCVCVKCKGLITPGQSTWRWKIKGKRETLHTRCLFGKDPKKGVLRK